jgi:ankyrin repeat protein
MGHNLYRYSKDAAGNTALHASVASDRDACAKLLIRRGANVGVTDGKGRTPLDAAMERGHIKVRPLLPGLFYVLFGVRTQRFYPQMPS